MGERPADRTGDAFFQTLSQHTCLFIQESLIHPGISVQSFLSGGAFAEIICLCCFQLMRQLLLFIGKVKERSTSIFPVGKLCFFPLQFQFLLSGMLKRFQLFFQRFELCGQLILLFLTGLFLFVRRIKFALIFTPARNSVITFIIIG